MKPARIAMVAGVVLVVLTWSVWRSKPADAAPAFAPSPATGATVIGAPVAAVTTVSPELDPLAGLVGEGLNAADGTIERDLEILQEILFAWQSNFPGQGNPVGENREIMAMLAGGNQRHLTLIELTHPAMNAKGELCDRWGSPFVFHQISGTHMEIRSAGPDRQTYSADDVVRKRAGDDG